MAIGLLDTTTEHKALLAPLRRALYDFTPRTVKQALQALLDEHAVVHMPHPFADLVGAESLYDQCYASLFSALPDLECRDFICIAGDDLEHNHWVGYAGYYAGTFLMPWLDIPPTGHPVYMRFHEFYRIHDKKIVEVQCLWDIPEIMMQSRSWPMSPPLGRKGFVPAPATQDGIMHLPFNAEASMRSRALVLDMLAQLAKHPKDGNPEVMELEKFWHPRMNWYGPAGVGTTRGISGFRQNHQIPFLNAMPDRGQIHEGTKAHFFADHHYVAVTGWPVMKQTLSHDGWLGIPPTGKTITLASLDFWRIENGKIRENWVMFDLLDVYRQLGVDVLKRMRELTHKR